MYTRKPKDMTKFLVGITAAQALHTWQYADDGRLKQVGSTGPSLSVDARRQREVNRRTIGAYRNSKVATIATSARGDISRFTAKERAKITNRIKKKQASENKGTLARPELPKPQDRPMPDASLYRRPNL